MANGLSKLIKRARKANESNILAKLARNRFRVEELEDRIAPAAGAITNTGAALSNGNLTYTLGSGDDVTLDLGTDQYTITTSGGYTGEGVSITFDAVSGSATKITEIDFGSSVALDAATTLTITSNNGAVTNTLTVDSVVDTNDNTGTASIVFTNNAIMSALSVGTVTLSNTGIANWESGAVTGITTETVSGSMTVGAVGATGITASSSFAGSLTVTGSLAGPVTSANGIGAVTLEAGSTAAGAITATSGAITSITIGNGAGANDITVAGDIEAAGSIGAINGTTGEGTIAISGAITAGTNLAAIGDSNDYIDGITGAITAQTIAGINMSGNLTGGVTASGGAGTIGSIDIGSGTLGTVSATGTTGSIGDITAAAITGGITATDSDTGGTDNAIGAIITSGAVSGNISGYSIDDLAITGALSGTITVVNGFDDNNGLAIGSVSSTGGIVVTTGDLDGSDDIAVSGDMAGSITATAGAIAADVTITGALTGKIEATAGSISGAITAKSISGGTETTPNIKANTSVGNIIVTDGDFGGYAVSSTTMGNIDVRDGNLSATVVSGSTIGTIDVTDDVENNGTTETTDDGNISGTITATGTIGEIVIEDTLSGTITASGYSGAISTGADEAVDDPSALPSGGISSTGSITATTGNFAELIRIYDGGMAGTITATDGDILGGIQILDTVTSSTTNGVDNDAVLSGTVSAGDEIKTGAITISDGISSTGQISATTDLASDITVTEGGMAGTITSATLVSGDITISDGGMSGTISATGTSADISGQIQILDSDADDDGTFSGTISALGTISGAGISVSDGITSTGAVSAVDDISATVTVTDGGMAGTISATTLISGELIVTDGGMSGTLTSASLAGCDITIGDGATAADDTDDTLSGTIQATSSNGVNVIDSPIKIDGGITADGKIISGDNISSAITIGTGSTTADMAGKIEASGDVTSAIVIDDDLSGTIQALTGAFGTGDNAFLTVGGDITSTATLSAKTDLAGRIAVTGTVNIPLTFEGDVTSTITAQSFTGAITVGGDLGANVSAISGTTGVIGNISAETIGKNGNVTIQADDGIGAITTTGAIGTTGANTVTITADQDGDNTGDLTSVTSGGLMRVAITGENIGAITSGGTAADDIEGTIRAASDIDGVDAGFGTVMATVSAGAATSGSPLAWVVAEGVTYAVWALDPTTGAEMAGVTANVEFALDTAGDGVDNAGDQPTITITGITGTTSAAPIDLKVVTTADNGTATPTLTDADLDIDAIGSDVIVALSSATPIYINDLDIEGQYTTSGSDPDIIVAGATTVEGGIGGTFTLNLANQTSYTFKSIAANTTLTFTGTGTVDPTITILEGIDDTGGNVTLTIAGSNVAALNVGDASQNKTADVGAAGGNLTTINAGTNTIGEIVVAGNLYGTVSAASIGNVIVDGNLGDTVASQLHATAGSIGNVNVKGSIDLTLIKAENAADQSTATIGYIAAGANLADGASMTISAGGAISGIHAGGYIGDNGAGHLVTITTLNGGIAEIIADGNDGVDDAMNLDVDVAGDIDLISANSDGNAPIEGVKIQSRTGNIGTIQTVDSAIDIDIKALAGDIDNILVNDGPTDADLVASAGIANNLTILAGGDIDSIVANAIGALTTITAEAATANSPVTTWLIGTTLYSLEAEGGTDNTTYGYNWVNGVLDLTINNAADADATDDTLIEISLTTEYSVGVTDADNEMLDDTQFDLATLNFTAGSIADDLASLTVEGEITGLVQIGSVATLLVEGNVAQPIQIVDNAANPIEAVAMATAMGVDDPDATALAQMFSGTAVAFEAPAVGTTYQVPVTGANGDVSFAIYDAESSAFITPVVLSLGNDGAGNDAVGFFDVTVLEGDALDIDAARWAAGAITIEGDLDYIIFGTNVDAVTITGSILEGAGINAYNIDAINIGVNNSFTGGDLNGFIRVVMPDDEQFDLELDGDFDAADTALMGMCGAITVFGSVGATGEIYVEGDLTSLTVGDADFDYGELDAIGTDETNEDNFSDDGSLVGTFAGNLAVLGDSGNITSMSTLGGTIMVGGDCGDLLSTYDDVTANIFIGGTNGADDVAITGDAISGNIVVGAIGGIDTLTLTVREGVENNDQETYTVSSSAGHAIMVNIAAGNVTGSALTVDSITSFGPATALNATSANFMDNVTVDNIFFLANSGADCEIDVEGTIGDIVGADGLPQFQSSATIMAGISANYDLLKYDAVTALDAANDDNTDTNLDLEFTTNLLGIDNIVATGDITVTSTADGQLILDNTDFGNVVSLDGAVTIDLDAENIGHVFAYGNVENGNLLAQGTVAVGDATALTASLTTYGLTLPANFTGGIMSASGYVGNGALVITGMDLSAPEYATEGYVVGAVTALVGDVDADINATGGDFGGLIIPLGDYEGALAASENIDLILIPGYDAADGTYTNGETTAVAVSLTVAEAAGDLDAETTLIAGETVISNGQSYDDGNLEVSTDDSGVLAYVNNAGNALTVINGLAANNTISVVGNLTTLTVDGTWAGTVDMMSDSAGALGQTSEATGYTVGTVNALGDIDASTAQLLAVDFTTFNQPAMYSLINDSATDNFVIGGQLNSDNNSVQFTNTAGETQTVVLIAGKAVAMDYEMYFGKITEATLTGRGGVSIVSTTENVVGATANETVKNAKAVLKNAARYGVSADDGTANLGDISVHGTDKVNINGMVVDGNLTSLNSGLADVKDLYVNGSVSALTIGDDINNAFISGQVTDLVVKDSLKDLTMLGTGTASITANKINNLYVDGAINDLQASVASKVVIDGNVNLDFTAVKASDVVIDGNITDFSVANINGLIIDGNATNFHAANIKNASVSEVGTLTMQSNGSIINSTFAEGAAGNVDTTKRITYMAAANGTGAGGAVGDLVLKKVGVRNNPDYIKVRNSALDPALFANSAPVVYMD